MTFEYKLSVSLSQQFYLGKPVGFFEKIVSYPNGFGNFDHALGPLSLKPKIA